ncbi:hypothetical protein EV363DRAFT_1166427, partial [Boletus edulis]
GYIVGVSRPLCVPCMRSWLWRVSRRRQPTLVWAMDIVHTFVFGTGYHRHGLGLRHVASGLPEQQSRQRDTYHRMKA